MAKTSESMRNAISKYKAKFDNVQITVPLGKKEELKEHAKKQGESLNAFVNRAIDTQIELDNETRDVFDSVKK